MAISTSNKPHWQDRLRHISNSRMIWYGDPGDDQYDFTHKEFTSYLKKSGFSIDMVKPLYPHRLLLEGIAFYRWAFNQPWGQFLKKWAERLLQNKDGHMLLVVGCKLAT